MPARPRLDLSLLIRVANSKNAHARHERPRLRNKPRVPSFEQSGPEELRDAESLFSDLGYCSF